jgi:serine/threonine protein kinase
MSQICFPVEKTDQDVWVIKGIIGEKSMFGQVFLACKQGKCSYVMKVIKGESHKEIENEVNYQNKCAKANLCRPVEDSWLCKDKGGVIITSILKTTLKTVIKSNRNNSDTVFALMKNLLSLVASLHDIDIYHGDLHLNNVMLDENSKMLFIDMGNSGTLHNSKDMYKKISTDYQDIAIDINVISIKDGDVCNVIFEKLINALDSFALQYRFLSLNGLPSLSDITELSKEIFSNCLE